MTVKDIIDLGNKLNKYDSILSAYDNEENGNKPQIVIKNVGDNDIGIPEDSSVTESIMDKIREDFNHSVEIYNYLKKYISETFDMKFEDLVDTYLLEYYINNFKDAMNKSLEKESRSKLTLVLADIEEGDGKAINSVEIALEDIHEKNDTFLMIQPALDAYRKRLENARYIKVTNWLAHQTSESIELDLAEFKRKDMEEAIQIPMNE